VVAVGAAGEQPPGVGGLGAGVGQIMGDGVEDQLLVLLDRLGEGADLRLCLRLEAEINFFSGLLDEGTGGLKDGSTRTVLGSVEPDQAPSSVSHRSISRCRSGTVRAAKRACAVTYSARPAGVSIRTGS